MVAHAYYPNTGEEAETGVSPRLTSQSVQPTCYISGQRGIVTHKKARYTGFKERYPGLTSVICAHLKQGNDNHILS